MEMTSSQRIPWYSRVASTASWAVGGVASGIGTIASKTVSAWVHTPKALKLPFETAAILYAPEKCRWQKGGLIGATILAETPKGLAAFLSNQPIQYIVQAFSCLRQARRKALSASEPELSASLTRLNSFSPRSSSDFKIE